MNPIPRCAALAVAALITIPALEGLAAADCPLTAMRYSSSSQRVYITGDVTCTLTDLDAKVSHAVLERTNATGKVWILRANLTLEQGAKLVLHGAAVGGDVNVLQLRSNDSATAGQVVSIRAEWGTIDIDGVTITSWDEVAGAPDTRPESNGRAYIQVRSKLDDAGVARESRMDIKNSDIGYLGYNASEAYGLSWKVIGSQAGIFDKVDVFGDVVGNHLHHNYFGAYSFGALGMTWIDNEIDHNVKYGLDPHDDSDSLVVSGNDIHDNGNHGFICAERCDSLEIRNNRSWNNVGNGFMLYDRITNTVFEDNEAFANGDAGLAIYESFGNVVRNNSFHNNRSGVRLSVGSSDNLVQGNDIADNRYGIYLFKGTDVPIASDGVPRRNSFEGNVVTGSERAIWITIADENEFIANVFGPSSGTEAMVFEDGQGNVLARNIIPADSRIHTKTRTLTQASTIITQAGGDPGADGSLLIDNSGYGTTTFVETAELSHMVIGLTTATTATPSQSTMTLGQISPRTVQTVPIFAVPASGSVLITPTSATGWKAQAVGGSISTAFAVGKLTPGAAYRVLRNGALLATATADGAGVVRFTTAVATTSATYAVSP